MIRTMIFLLGLTSTKKERIPAFISALRSSAVRHIALFPTCLSKEERRDLYEELGSIPGLRIPHVHLRADCDIAEISLLEQVFGSEAFNIHPRLSSHPYDGDLGEFAPQVFIENGETPVEDAEFESCGGLCPDFSHLENARLCGRSSYVDTTLGQLTRHRIGCCHISAIRFGFPNSWSGEWDHHTFISLSDFDYLGLYRRFLPEAWASLELENPFEEQLEARAYIEALVAT